MSSSPDQLADILHDDSLAPLKRNHACLNCKKRKTRCCGTRPVCSPCMRSHAHAMRSANKNGTTPPVLCCEWADEGNDNDQPQTSENKKRVPEKKVKGSFTGKVLEREKEKRRDEEKETLLARIAELESRLANLSPSDPSPQQRLSSSNMSMHTTPESISSRPVQVTVEDYILPIPDTYSNPATFKNQMWADESMAEVPAAPTSDFTANGYDFSGLFMVPLNWPAGLPSPFLLDHLVETFFTHVPQLPRMIHRATLLTRLRLPPTDQDFPHPSLLHAICAIAAPYTAWVNSLPPESLESAVSKHQKIYGNMENIEDFGLAQAELAQKSIRLSTQVCIGGPGSMIIEICQANIILSDLYFQKGMPMVGWMLGGTPARLLKALEFMNKNRREQYKDPIAEDPKDSVEREERLATVWMAFIMDAGCTLNSYWNGSMDIDEIYCPLPIDIETFRAKTMTYARNPQTPQTPDLLTHHPVADSFVLAAKASILVSRSSKWIRQWLQRDILPGDELTGLRWPSFSALVNDIHAFQASVPGAMRSLFKAFESSATSPLDANVILIHILPNVALCLIHEPFVDWNAAEQNHAMTQVQKGFEGVLGILHLIPSNLDMTLVAGTLMVLCLYTCGRLIANFVQRSLERQQFGLAVRHRADLQTVQSLLNRYGQKHALGLMMSNFLEEYLSAIQSGRYKERGQICARLHAREEMQMANEVNQTSTESTMLPPNMFGNNTAESSIGDQTHLTWMLKHADDIRAAGATSDSSGYTPPGASASGSGSSGAPTPNDLFDFSQHVQYTDGADNNTFLMSSSIYSGVENSSYGQISQINAFGGVPIETRKTAEDDQSGLNPAVAIVGETMMWGSA